LLFAAGSELRNQGLQQHDITGLRVMALVRSDPTLSRMKGKKELFALLVGISDIELRGLFSEIGVP